MPKSVADLVQAAKAIIDEITPEQATTMLAEGSIALDVREPQEHENGCIPDACHIPRGMLEFMIEQHPNFQDKDASVIVYCKSGGRSALATATLKQLGYTQVYSLLGGFESWK